MPEDEQIQKALVLELLERHSPTTNLEETKMKRTATGQTDIKCYRSSLLPGSTFFCTYV